MDLQSILQTWIDVLTKPGEAVFAAEREKSSATLGTALMWIIAAAVVSALLGLLQVSIFATAMGSMGQMSGLLPPEVSSQLDMFIAQGTLTGLMAGVNSLGRIIATPILFIIGVGVYHLIASLLGGRGQFGRYAYLISTFGAPLSIVTSLLNFVPVVGGCFVAILAIYQVVLTYWATKVEYGLSDGRAIVVVLIPILAVLLLTLCVGVAIFGLLVSTTSSGP